MNRRLKRQLPVLLAVTGFLLVYGLAPARASGSVVCVASPDHEQTFAFGSEQNRVWTLRGADRHLAVILDFTNDPYVDRDNPRQYDHFTFDFPSIRLARDGHTLLYRAGTGRPVPVAIRKTDFLGSDEIRLVPNCVLLVRQPHGYLSLALIVRDAGTVVSDD